MIGADELAAMRADAHIINIARGSVIDQAALIDALEALDYPRAKLDIKLVLEEGDDLTIVMPEWQESLFKYFLPLYGEQSSEVIGQITGIIFEEIFGPMPEEMKHKGKLVRINHQ